MAFLTFPRFAIQSTTVAQPLIGSFITAGIGGPSNIPLTLTLGNLCAGSGFSDSQVFIPGSLAYLIDPGATHGEHVLVKSIVTGGNVNQIVIGPRTSGTPPGGPNNPVTVNPHVSGGFGTGTWILLHTNVNSVYVQPEDGNAGTYMYIGSDIAMTPTNSRIVKLAKVASGAQPNDWSSTENSPGNPFITSELWVLGGANNSSDSYMVALTQD